MSAPAAWYHGTPHPFAALADTPPQRNTGDWNNFLGIAHFSSSPQVAEQFTHGHYPRRNGTVFTVENPVPHVFKVALTLSCPRIYEGEGELALHALSSALRSGAADWEDVWNAMEGAECGYRQDCPLITEELVPDELQDDPAQLDRILAEEVAILRASRGGGTQLEASDGANAGDQGDGARAEGLEGEPA